ncbi:isopentenyl-diphosphate Delta-isomerase [Thiocystis violascens]|uniref:Isopentenyl-diphosphate Delta-isomerase n=1 Tax=Thiocystis violascens (strain ATCC 17096 / DSM 198 / 6111) TaxID=765911 RepID=I3YAD1_THIV6|nr:isopentenyl-diphosphate Delta-isomerase [Thiocystis violascens]AFL73949.1 isopentenyl-diphosphate delta-isomerase [Thiocystis violascens DSM 198]
MSAQIVRPLAADELERTAQRDALEEVIVVDQEDRMLGAAGKLDVHRTGDLHRAFSILVFNADGDLLLQRRADVKYHFAKRWSNTCCGHPRPGESTSMAAGRRLKEEFGIRVPLTERAQLIYRAEDQDSGLIEHEYLHIFHGVYAGVPHPDPAEIGAWRWMGVPVIPRALRVHPEWFTPWFPLLIGRLLTE